VQSWEIAKKQAEQIKAERGVVCGVDPGDEE
jgi:hypothetical protein